MLKRKATRQLETWLEAPTPKALLIKGARQVGKSYLAEAFLRERFEHVVKFDLLEDSATKESFLAARSAKVAGLI